jgi:transcriptional regulator with XRE-family HTH domain
MSKFKDRFQELKKESGKSQAEIAKDLEMTPQALSYYANGREPNYDTLIKMAEYFNTTTDYLIGKTNARREENQTVVKELGLSDKSIQFIKMYPYGETGADDDPRTLLDVLNSVLESVNFIRLLTVLKILTSSRELEWKDIGIKEEVFPNIINNQKIPSVNALYKNQAYDCLNDVIDEIKSGNEKK